MQRRAGIGRGSPGREDTPRIRAGENGHGDDVTDRSRHPPPRRRAADGGVRKVFDEQRIEEAIDHAGFARRPAPPVVSGAQARKAERVVAVVRRLTLCDQFQIARKEMA